MRLLTTLLLVCSLWRAAAYNSTNLADVFANIGFDPAATNCATIVQLSDIHMTLTELGQDHILTNLNPNLVTMINSMVPSPDAIVVTGDSASDIGPSTPGTPPIWPEGTNELVIAIQQLDRLTNRRALYMTTGNHDSQFGRYDGEPWKSITGCNPYTNFTIANLPVVMLDTANNGVLSQQQAQWLDTLPIQKDKPVLLFCHIPISQGQVFGWQSSEEILWWLGQFNSSVFVGVGHDHYNYMVNFNHGAANITESWCPSTINPNDPAALADGAHPAAAGFIIWCITNGTVQATIKGALTNQMYYTRGTNTTWATSGRPYEAITNVLFRVEEGHFNRSAYEVTADGGDITYWRLWCSSYQARLPIEQYTNATRVFYRWNSEDTNTMTMAVSHDKSSWTTLPWEFYVEGVGAADLPVGFRTGPLYLRVTGNATANVAGFGLGTTNTLTAWQAWAGKELGNANASPWGPVAFPNAYRYAFGLHKSRVERHKVLPAAPWTRGLPFRDLANPTFLTIPTRPEVTYTVDSGPSTNGPWAPLEGTTWTPTNGWGGINFTNAGSNYVRITIVAEQ